MNENENNVEVVEETTVETTDETTVETTNEAAYEEPQAEVVESCECAGKGKKHKKLWPLIGIGAAVVAAAAALAIFFSNPWILIESGIKNSTKAIRKNEVISLMSDICNGGSVEEVIDLNKLVKNNEDLYANLTELDGTISMKYYSNISKAETAMAVSYKKDSKDVLDAKFYLNKENFAIASDTLLDGDTYGISLKDFTKNLKDSEFGPDGKYYIGDEVFEVLENIDPEKWDELDKDTQKLAKSIYKEALKTIKKNSTVKKSTETLSFGDKNTKVNAVNIQMDDEQMADFLESMLKYLQNDKQLKEYLEKHGEIMVLAAQGMDAEDAVDDFYDALDDMEDELDDIEDELDDAQAKLEVTIYITKLTRQAVGFEMRTKEDGETVSKIALLAGPNLKNVKEISLSVDDEKFVYEVITNNASTYEAKLKIPDDSSGKLTYDKKSGEFNIQLKEDSEEICKISGTIRKEKKEITISLDRITAEEQTVKLQGVMTLILRTEDAAPAMPEYTEVLKMSASDMETAIQELMTAVQNLAQDFVN